ncbi:RES family NAD+ phosphorylase [Herbaspirillum rubrisubalbicans]|uniref:RES family NAD+ phosphorylase n=1 Tax=Herbaspirillum rubrisubalbicans TaxID=80842 RepID=UPI00209C9D3A|nr:RES family NAD+ phosphorylase [Herbaspirillum rubrisubalbicans]MCP1575102.1 RES domain-containing protein [Herbaspirillum rubrisubalbicans]
MILTSLETVAYRVHVPRWSFVATSGAGAARFGGRLNRPGVAALYLSLDPGTALAEYQQLDDLLPPGLIVAYRIVIDRVVDFRGGYAAGWSPLWKDFYCDWRRMVFHERVEPPSWVMGDAVRAAGAKGILFRSTRLETGCNLTVFTEMLADSDQLAVYDPQRSLPVNQASWP